MSEQLENVREEQTENLVEPMEQEPVLESESEPEKEPVSKDNGENGISEEKMAEVVNMIRTVLENKDKILKDLNERREYLIHNLGQYDNENYLQNDAFKSLYSQAFSALGTKLDTPKFIELVEDYVNSRIELNNRKLAAQKENESITDSLEFKRGVSKKSEKPLRLQDIPPEELERYIALYI